MDIEQDEFTHMGMILDRVLAVNPGINGGVRSVPPLSILNFPRAAKDGLAAASNQGSRLVRSTMSLW